jgi:UDP-GlcNAc:undecaprenyl-phosphate GlcNAc-1-phosphate transferase
MGDSGSQLIGFVLATLGLMASYKEAGTTIATLALPVLILAVPILDTTLVTALRLRSGRSVTQGGRDHTSHRLVYRGLSERRAVIFLVAISAGLGLTSLAYAVLDSGRITTIGVLVTFALLLQFAAFLSGVAAAPGESGLSARASLLVDTLVDGALTVAAFYASYVIVVEGNGTPYQRHIFIWALPAVLLCRYVALFAFGLYRPGRTNAKRSTLTRIAAAVVLSELAAYFFVTNTHTLNEFPATIFALDAAICFVLVSVGRFAERAALRMFRSWRGRSGTVAAS